MNPAPISVLSSWPTTLPLLTHYYHASLFVIGEGNGNSLQCSCLENPRDGGVWWAALYGVAQSWTRLKWLSSSSSLYVTPPIFQACSHFKSLFWPFLQPGMKESSSLKLFIWLTFLPSTSLASNVTASISVKTILTALFTVLICFPQVPLPWFSWYPSLAFWLYFSYYISKWSSGLWKSFIVRRAIKRSMIGHKENAVSRGWQYSYFGNNEPPDSLSFQFWTVKCTKNKKRKLYEQIQFYDTRR